jgi:PAS domain S-box-containing protein
MLGLSRNMRPEDLGIGKLFERVRDAVIVADAASQQIVLWNPAATKIFGYSLSEALELRVEALVPDHLKDRHRTGIVRYGETGHGDYIDSQKLLDLPALKKGGEEIRVELSLNPIGPSGDAAGRFVLAIIRDITDRKRAEAALRDAEALFRSVFDNASIGVAVVGLDGRFERVNHALCEILGYSEEEFLATTFGEITHTEDLDISMVYFRRALEGEIGTYSLEKRYIGTGGRPVWVSLDISLVRDSDGNPLYFVDQIQDITDRKRAESKLREAETRYRTIVENIPAAVYIQPADNTQALTYISPQIEQILGYTQEELLASVGRNWINLLHSDDRERVLAEDERTNETGEPFREEYRQRAKDGRYAWIREESVLVHGEAGEPIYWQGFLWDITERKETEEEIRHLNETLEKRVAERTAQLAEREDRLRTLLGKLVVAQEEERRRVAYEVHDGLAQMIVAVQQHLQAFAKQHPPDSVRGKESLEWNLALIQQTIEEARRVIGGLRPTALDDFGLATALRLEVETLRSEGWDISYVETLGDDRLPPTMETALYRVAQETLTNVRKHADTTSVRLSLGRLGQEIRLRVRDRGRGFSRTETVSGGGPGKRVGIAGMEERVALLGGKFTVLSRLGAGTLIVARVPITDSGEDVGHG